MRLSDAFPSPWLAANDLPDAGLSLTIKGYDVQVIGQGERKEEKPVLHFREPNAKPLILNKTNGKSIEKIVGTDDMDAWIGHTITFVAREVEFQGETVWAVRVQVPRTKPSLASSPAASASSEDDWGAPVAPPAARVLNAVERVTLIDAVQAKSMPPAIATEIIGRFGFAKSTDVTVDMRAEVLAAISDWQAPNTNPRNASPEMAPESPREIILDLVQALEGYGMTTNQVYDIVERVAGVRDAAHIQPGDNDKVIALLNSEFSSRRKAAKA